ncbi:hypothetical protein COU23_01545 [Candidatus Kuenenbacteria bacterium CG10_big_fil_rev_8_21_14_0_10_36_11]|uniref:Uncharacterized protein n=1 Tax=Candidatus Kuenenbacteria bacterium CG10_big_fil_rev_8_21_14_0_10_36_11 TaxID=1974618 RepID=A0A2M6WAT7_9BACT|nr:MAG: hypothetical protein COU23_01545 [Candidatus Kuenenbacteria bacterium CG10_big_fil_rev_8_21_14_0_10_36_11]
MGTVAQFYCAGFPYLEISGSKLAWELPGAYRTLPRPSSPFEVKASTIRHSSNILLKIFYYNIFKVYI